jgi:aspartyl/glutamyl-tRNA(Asn/Gln) amidotransferase C subunit
MDRLAKLAGLSLTEQEKQELQHSIQSLIHLVHPITTVQTAKDVEPLVSLVADQNALIFDKISEDLPSRDNSSKDQEPPITLTKEPFGHEILKQSHSKVDEFMYVVKRKA